MTLGVLSSGLISCTPPPVVLRQRCEPPPAPECQPGHYDGVGLDTLFHGVGTVQNHISALPMPLNGNSDDYAITIYESVGREIGIVTSNRTRADGQTSWNRESVWAFLTKTGKSVPVTGLEHLENVGTGTYCEADGRFYFAASGQTGDPDDFDLYSAKMSYVGGSLTFTDIHAEDALNEPRGFDSQPAVDASGTTLVFASDRAGGDGGTDLWVSHRASRVAAWQTPTLLDEHINTACDELSPSFGRDGNFYFSSNGHATVGGYDLFRSTYHNGAFGIATNLGTPINTQYDELFPVWVNDTGFYWASKKPDGLTGWNLYTITRTSINGIHPHPEVVPSRPEIARLDTLPRGPVQVYVDVTRGRARVPAAGAELFVRRDSTEIYRAKSPTSGKFKLKLNRDVYDIGAENSDAFFDVRHVDLRTLDDSDYHLTLNVPDTLVLRINFPFDDHEHPYEFVMNDDGTQSTMTWQTVLDLTAQSVLRAGAKLKKLLVVGHTDSLGSDAYNDRLGEQRAAFVATELEKRGVQASLISVGTRGRREPVERRPGEADEQFRLRSRRVEFVKVF